MCLVVLEKLKSQFFTQKILKRVSPKKTLRLKMTSRYVEPRRALFLHMKGWWGLDLEDCGLADKELLGYAIESGLLPSISPAEASALAGNFPHNIAEWIWSATPQDDGDAWLLLCRLTTGAYAFLSAKEGSYGFKSYGSSVRLALGHNLATIVEFGLTESWYNLYMRKTTGDPSVVLNPVVDPYPQRDPSAEELAEDAQRAANAAELAAQQADKWVCGWLTCGHENNGCGTGDISCRSCGKPRGDAKGTDNIVRTLSDRLAELDVPLVPTSSQWGPYRGPAQLAEHINIAHGFLNLLFDQIRSYPVGAPRICPLVERYAEFIARLEAARK